MVYITAERFIPETDKLTVRQLRQSLGCTQQQLADTAGVSVNSVNRVEDPTYRNCISNDVMERIADALGEPVHRVRWFQERTDGGRPVGPGRPLRLVKSPQEEVCKTCFIILPATGICDDCS